MGAAWTLFIHLAPPSGAYDKEDRQNLVRKLEGWRCCCTSAGGYFRGTKGRIITHVEHASLSYLTDYKTKSSLLYFHHGGYSICIEIFF